MSENQRLAAIADGVDRDRSRRILRLVDGKLRELAEEVIDLLREQKDGAQGFELLWEAICYCVARGTPDDLNNYESPTRAFCWQVLGDYGDRFVSQLLATATTDCDEFYRKAALREKPPSQSLDEWTTKAIYARLLDLARDEAKSSFLSYDPKLLNQVIACLRSLIPLADSGSSLAAIGRAIEAIEAFERGRRGNFNADIGCGFRAGDAEFQEGEFAFIEIREESIGLSTLHTTYEKLVGSDNSSDDFAFPGNFEEWREIFDRIRDDEQAKLSVSLHD